MWLNDALITDTQIARYQQSLTRACPNHIVIDGLFNEHLLDKVIDILQQPHHWQPQQHTYSALYVDPTEWQHTPKNERFVQRDQWQRDTAQANIANAFLSYLRDDEFMTLLSRIFKVPLTDITVENPSINTNYFRLDATDFVEQHADDSPGREVCMLLYLNKEWNHNNGGELNFIGNADGNPISIAPLHNRCILFTPSSEGAEHWVEKLRPTAASQYRYNVTSWYWSE
jgi:Rps23 Pro-64 3,4-dihydroxylase Tpa1-like proline 4-hydroxylase